jgi:hypothetical protein
VAELGCVRSKLEILWHVSAFTLCASSLASKQVQDAKCVLVDALASMDCVASDTSDPQHRREQHEAAWLGWPLRLKRLFHLRSPPTDCDARAHVIARLNERLCHAENLLRGNEVSAVKQAPIHSSGCVPTRQQQSRTSGLSA